MPQPDALSGLGSLEGAELRRAMSLVTWAWVFGSVWFTSISGAPVTLFAKHLRASNFEFGLLAALPFIASFLSIHASLLIERTGQRKRIFMTSLYAQRALWIPIALVPLWIIWRWGEQASRPAMVVFLVLLFVMHSMGSFGGPAWTSWLADIVPDRLRGRYFARRRQWGLLSAIPAAVVVGWLLDHSAAGSSYQTLRLCALVFACAAVFGIADIAMFHPVPHIRVQPQPHLEIWQLLRGPLRNKEFLWFGGFVATLIFAISFMGQFVTLFLIEKIRIDGKPISNTGIQLMLLVAPMLAQLMVFHLWGRAVDRLGRKPALIIGALGLVPVGFGWCLMNSAQPWVLWFGYCLSALGGAFWTGVEVANLNVVLEFSGSRDDDAPEAGGSAYFVVNSLIINIAGMLGGLSSGVLAQLLKNWSWDTHLAWLGHITFYEVLFGLSGMLRLLAVVVFLPHLHEHGAGSAREVLRFMGANIYNNLFSSALQPLRYLRLKWKESYVE
jgi:MFS family permease